MFLGYQTLISTMHLTSLVNYLKIVGILQNFEICTKFCPLHKTSIGVPTVIIKTHLGNKDCVVAVVFFFLKPIIMVLTPLSTFCYLHQFFG